MSYIAFLDMLGSRAAALTSSKEYRNAINDFNSILQTVGENYNASIYAYSDNAYVEISDINEMIEFFQCFREQLFLKHRYFSAAIDYGRLKGKIFNDSDKKHPKMTMMFTGAKVVDVYLEQCSFSGIGFKLSQRVVDDLKRKSLSDKIRYSLYQTATVDGNKCYKSVADIAYVSTSFEELSFIMSDYITTVIMNKRASRYYVTPIITMIKSLNSDVIENNLDNLIKLITLQKMPKEIKNTSYEKTHVLFFVFSLIDYVLLMKKSQNDLYKIVLKIIENCNIKLQDLLQDLSNIPVEIISDYNKKIFLKFAVKSND